MSRTLRELTDDFDTLRELGEAVGDEASEEFSASLASAFAELEGDVSRKMDGCACIIAEWKAEADLFAAEITRMQARKKTILGNIDRLKERMLDALKGAAIQKTKGLYCVSQRKPSASVVIDDVELLPLEFVKVTKTADKTAIKKAWPSAPMDGAHIELKEGLGIR